MATIPLCFEFFRCRAECLERLTFTYYDQHCSIELAEFSLCLFSFLLIRSFNYRSYVLQHICLRSFAVLLWFMFVHENSSDGRNTPYISFRVITPSVTLHGLIIKPYISFRVNFINYLLKFIATLEKKGTARSHPCFSRSY